MPKQILTRPARNSFRDLAIGLATFFTISLLVGAISTDAFSFAPRSFESHAQPAGLQSSQVAAPSQPASLAMNQFQVKSGILATPSYQRPLLAQHSSFSYQQMGILLLAMMFALISLFVRQSTRHLRRAAATKRRQDWAREDWLAR